MKAIITTVIAMISAVGSVLCYPIDPRPLRKLIMESEFIVVGHVLAVKKTKEKDAYGQSLALISISEVLQGEIAEKIIEVPFNPNYVCPAPARYFPDTDVMVFLNKKKGTFYTHALSYGSKTLSVAEMDIYKSRIKEMQDILTINDSYHQFFETVEWLVKCAEQRPTRWEGIFELSPESDFMSYYSRSDLPPFQSLLSPTQRERLKTALFAENEPDYTDLGLIDLVYRGNEKEVHHYLLYHLKQLPEDRIWYGAEFMARILQGKSTEKMEALVKEFSEKRFTERNSNAALKTIINEFVALAEK